MYNTEHFDLLVLGSGEGGKYTAWNVSAHGKKTAVIEERWIGGSCPNTACLPTKNVIYSAKVVHNARVSSFGLQANQTTVDMKTVIDRKRDMVKGLVDMHIDNFNKFGSQLILGRGKFIGKKEIEVIDPYGKVRVLTADNIVVSTGSRAKIDERVPGLKEANPLTHIEILELEVLPSHLVVLGGGYIGLELAQAMRRLGAQVSVIEHNPQILKNEDADVAGIMRDVLTKEGVKIYTSAQVKLITGTSGTEVTVEGTSAGESFTIKGSHILVAVGREPNTENIGLEIAGIGLTESKHIKVDEYLRTTAEGIFAVGDCAGSPHFTHVAYDDFRVVTSTVLGAKTPRSTKGRQIPSTLYLSPEVAQVGLREKEAKSLGIEYRLAKAPMLAFLRTRTLGETEGFAKALIAPDDSIIGFTAVGPGVGDLLPVIQLAMQEKLPYERVRDLIIVHPTLSEGLVGLFSGVLTKP